MDIYFVDQTQNNPLDVDINDLIAALQEQVSRDFAPLWGIDATLHVAEEQNHTDYTVLLMDSVMDQNAMGFHINDNNVPVAKCGIGDALKYHVDPTTVISHELLEMLADPFTNRLVAVANDTRQFMVEVCDPCTEYYYQIGDITVSDFCTPRYFGYTNVGHFDQLGKLDSSCPYLGYGGMVMWWDGQKYSNTFARTIEGDLSWRVHHTGRNAHRAKQMIATPNLIEQ